MTKNSQSFTKVIKAIKLIKTYAEVIVTNFLILWMNIILAPTTMPVSSQRFGENVVERTHLTTMKESDLGPGWACLRPTCMTLGTCLRVAFSSHLC